MDFSPAASHVDLRAGLDDEPAGELPICGRLYGYATGILENQTGAEIFYDNVSVTPNKK